MASPLNCLSENITIFPYSHPRSSTGASARLLNEQNIRFLMKGASGTDSYVITEHYDDSKPFEFVIHNYYIKCESGLGIDLTNVTSVTAYIEVNEELIDNGISEIMGTDESGKCTAVNFISDMSGIQPSHVGHKIYSLPLLVKSGAKWEVVTNSFKRTSGIIDGGNFDKDGNIIE